MWRLDSAAESEKRLSAWEQAIRLSPASSRILDAAEKVLHASTVA